MANTRSSGRRPKRVLLIDCVEWSEAYPADHPLRNVAHWFLRHFQDEPGVAFDVVHDGSDVQKAARTGVDGVIMSGSPRDAWADDPVNDKLGAVILDCRDRHVPFLGVCYGHQLLGRVLGGQVNREPRGLELGTAAVTLTEAGTRSPLFAGIPREVDVLQSHQDAVLSLPPGAELLAEGEHTRVQAFRHGAASWGVQFHPEMDPEILRFLWQPRREAWRHKVGFDLDARLDTLKPAPLAVGVLKNFVTRCLCKP